MSVMSLTASEQLRPAGDEVVEVVSGDVLVFAQAGDGPRCPLLTLTPGQWALGADLPPGLSVFLTGLPGTHVRVLSWDEAHNARGDALMTEWLYLLANAGRGERWADRVIAPADGPLRCAPGENVAFSVDGMPLADRSIQGWLRVEAGTARWCAVAEGEIAAGDAPVPFTRGVWLTSGLRCQFVACDAPASPQEWRASIDVVTRCVAAAAVDRLRSENEYRVSRLAGAEERRLTEMQDSVDLLAGAMVGPVVRKHSGQSIDDAAIAAALMVVRATGIDVPEDARDRATRDVESGRDPLQSIATACTARSREIDLPPRWWAVEGAPLVGRRKNGSYVALLPSRTGRVLVDPAQPDVTVPVTPEVAESMSTRAIELVPVLPAAPQTARSLFRLATRGSGNDVFWVLLLTGGVGLAAFVTPMVFGSIAASFATLTIPTLLALLGALGLVLVATTSWNYVRSLALLRIRTRALAIASGAMWDRLMRLRATWHEERSLGTRMSQATAISLAAVTVPDAIILALLDSVIVVGSLLAAATTNAVLLAGLVVLLVLQVAIGLLIGRTVARRVRVRVKASSAANGRLVETLRAVNRLRISGAESRALHRWAQFQAASVRADIGLRKATLAQSMLLMLWPVVIVISLVALSAATGASYAEFITIQTAAGIAAGAVAATLMATNALLSGRAALGQLDDVLAGEPEGVGTGANPGRLQGGLSVRDLSFRYIDNGAPVLDGVSFDVSPGEQVAIVGGSGCGKTTLMRVLLGLESPQSGTITVDGRDLASLDQPSVRRQVGCVLQSSSLLPGTVYDNVDMGRALPRSVVWEALDAACVGDDVRAMGLKLDTPVVDGGGTVSGGQRQRILIARALAGSPRMLVLDEATSALDNVTQAIVVETLDRLRLTRLVVAHRLSTIRGADRIIVLDRGRVVEEGPYEDLMALDGIFADLARRQLA